MKQRFVSSVAGMALALGLVACGDTTGPEGTTTVAFQAATGTSSSTSIAARQVAFSHSDDPDAPTLTASGTNGELTIASVHFVLSEFELERADADEDCDDAVDEEACEEFEAGMQFLELPLTGDDAVAVRQNVPAGRYDELEFEIEELEDDAEDDDAGEIDQLLTEIRQDFPDWPRTGSMRIHGTFTPADDQGTLLSDQARDFTVFFEAEVEIEKEFETPLEVAEGDNPSITVTVDPRAWFDRGDGTILDLSQFAFDPAAGGPVPELEVEIENGVGEGFAEVEIDPDDD
jgi:hypothetical protein